MPALTFVYCLGSRAPARGREEEGGMGEGGGKSMGRGEGRVLTFLLSFFQTGWHKLYRTYLLDAANEENLEVLYTA